MSLGRDLRGGGRIGRAEVVRSVRRYARDARRLLGLGLAVLFFGGTLLVSLPGVYLLGRQARSVASIPYFEPAATLLPVALLSFATLRTVERLGGADAEDLLLTTVHPRAVVVGLVTAEVGRLLLWFGLPLVVTAGAFAAGLGSPGLLVTGCVVLLPVVCCTAVWGYAVGIGVLRVLRRLPTGRRVLKLVGVLSLVAVVVGSQVAVGSAADQLPVVSLASALSVAPLADYLALGLVATPISAPITPVAVVVLAAWVGLTPVGLGVAQRQATALWFSDDPVRNRSPGRPSDRPASVGGFSPPRPFSWTRAGRVAWGHLVRATRHPQQLSHLLVVVFFAGPTAGPFLGGSGPSPLLVAGAGVGVGVYLAGATFGLNPLGDDRPQLPLLLLTGTPPRTFLRGRGLAGLAVGLPFAVLVPLASVAVGTRPLSAAAFAAVGAGLCPLAALFALGLGCSYPVYEERTLWGAETVAPSTLVLVGYTLVVLGGTAVGLAVTWLGLAGSLSAIGLLVGGLAYLLPTVGVPAAGYWYARRRYRRYVLE
jgi:hypothetical protein